MTKAYGIIYDEKKKDFNVITINYEMKDKKVHVKSFELDPVGSNVQAMAMLRAKEKLVRNAMGLDRKAKDDSKS